MTKGKENQTMDRYNKTVNITLGVAAALMLALCLSAVSGPLLFNNKREAREKVVKERLRTIMTAQTRYMNANGRYCGSIDSLVTGGWLADSLRYVPYSNGREFAMTATTTITKTGRVVPCLECGAAFEDYLQGLDEISIRILTDDATAAGRYPGLRIGGSAIPTAADGRE